MKKTICIVGAGPAGLHLGTQLASAFDVHIYEQLSEKELCQHCPWSDSIDLETLYLLGLPIPEKKGNRFYGELVKDGANRIGLYEPLKKIGSPRITVDRNTLITMLLAKAKQAGVTFHFAHTFYKLLGTTQGPLSHLHISGAQFQHQENILSQPAALVVDATGAVATLRTTLSSCIGDPVRSQDILSAYKTIRRVRDKDCVHRFTNGGLIEGKKGYRWISLLDDEILDIGCCIASSENDETAAHEEVLKLIQDIPEIGEEEFGGGGAVIPLTLPPNALVTNGFAVVGESANMTNPGNGCGISGAVLGATLLANTLYDCEDMRISSLWPYAHAWFSGRGALYASCYLPNPVFSKKEITYLTKEKLINGTLSNSVNFALPDATIGLLCKNHREDAAFHNAIERIYHLKQHSTALFKAYINYPDTWNEEEFNLWCQHTDSIKEALYHS